MTLVWLGNTGPDTELMNMCCLLSDPGCGERAELSAEAQSSSSGALSGSELRRARRLSGGGSSGRTRPRLQSVSAAVWRRSGAHRSAAATRCPAGERARLSAR